MSQARDILSRMRSTASASKPLATPVPDTLEVEALEAVPAPAPLPTPEPELSPPPRRRRFTLDLDPPQHRFLKRLALEAEVDAAHLLRTVLSRLEQDEALRQAVVEQAQEGRLP